MIKKIHYIWLGAELPKKNLQIVEEWKIMMPDFQFILWNEIKISKYECLFLRQCLRKKAYAFAADYLRLRIVNDFGGFYLDTDMKIIKSLCTLDVGDFMIGEEEIGRPNWSIFYSEPNSDILRMCLSKYDNLYFDQFKPPVIPYFLSDCVYFFKNTINILEPDYFYSLPMEEPANRWEHYITDKSVGVHLWDFSWNHFIMKRSVNGEVYYRLKILLNDFIVGEYPLYYFRINIIRIYWLIKTRTWL